MAGGISAICSMWGSRRQNRLKSERLPPNPISLLIDGVINLAALCFNLLIRTYHRYLILSIVLEGRKMILEGRVLKYDTISI